MAGKFTSVRVTNDVREMLRWLSDAEQRTQTTIATRLIRAEYERYHSQAANGPQDDTQNTSGNGEFAPLSLP